MSSFTCTLTGGSQIAICNLRNLREHFFSESRMKLALILPSVRNVYGAKLHELFLSKFRVKKVSGKTALTYTESVDTIKNVVLDLLTLPLIRLVCVISVFKKMRAIKVNFFSNYL